MPRRDTITEKWDDKWFLRLSPLAKLLWNYICDKCDCAGFWEIDLEWAAKAIRTTQARLNIALDELTSRIVVHDGWLWIRKFVFHQKNWPLNPENHCHKGILNRLQQHSDFGIDFQDEMLKQVKIEAPKQPLIRGYGKGKGNSNGKGKGKYTVEFESFWKSYPERWIPESDRHVKIGKDKAWEYWDKLSEQTQKLVLSVLPVFVRTIPPKIVPDAWRWLRDKKWKDYSVPDEKPSKKPQQTQSLRDKQRAEWTKFIKEAPEAKLVAVYKENTYGLRWLISELRPEIKDNLGKG